jgi:hypothetical protein
MADWSRISPCPRCGAGNPHGGINCIDCGVNLIDALQEDAANESGESSWSPQGSPVLQDWLHALETGEQSPYGTVDWGVNGAAWRLREIQEVAGPGKVGLAAAEDTVGLLGVNGEIQVLRAVSGKLRLVDTLQVPEDMNGRFPRQGLALCPDPLFIGVASSSDSVRQAPNEFLFVGRSGVESMSFASLSAEAVVFPPSSDRPLICCQDQNTEQVLIAWLDWGRRELALPEVLFEFPAGADYSFICHPCDQVVALHASLPQFGSETAFIRYASGALEVAPFQTNPQMESSNAIGFSADGNRLAYVGGSDVKVYTWPMGDLVRTTSSLSEPGSLVTVHDDDLSMCGAGCWVGSDVVVSGWRNACLSKELSRDENALIVFDQRLQPRVAEVLQQVDSRVSGGTVLATSVRGAPVHQLCGLAGDLLVVATDDGAVLFKLDRSVAGSK